MAYSTKKADINAAKNIIECKFHIANKKHFFATIGNVKSIDGGSYDPIKKSWTFPLTLENCEHIQDLGFEISPLMGIWIEKKSKPIKNHLDFATRINEEVIDIEIGRSIIIFDPPEDLKYHIKQKFEMPNPIYEENQKRGRFNHGVPKKAQAWSESKDDGWIALSRGCESQLLSEMQKLNLSARIEDYTTYIEKEVPFSFKWQLRPDQEAPCNDILSEDIGVLVAPTGAGKTVMALYVIAERKQPTIIMVHTKELLYQWKERCMDALGYEPGLIGDGNFDIRDITIATVQTINKKKDFDFASKFSFLVVDEVHKTPSSTFINSVKKFSPFYLLGVSATPYRRDGLSKFIFWTMGDKVHEVFQEDLLAKGKILRPKIVERHTDFNTSGDYMKQIAQIVNWKERNEMICDDVLDLLDNKKPGIIVILADRVAHLENISEILSLNNADHSVLTGSLATKKRKKVVNDLNNGKIKILLATTSLLQEGFDCAELTYLLIASPIKYKGKLKQIIGRVIRTCKSFDKVPLIYDYVDPGTIFQVQFRGRREVYDTYKG